MKPGFGILRTTQGRSLGQPFPWKAFSRALCLQVIFLVSVLAASGLMGRRAFEREFLRQSKTLLEDGLTVLSRHMNGSLRQEWCADNARGTELRLTLLRSDGTVLCDSHHDPQTMENHLGRPEILAALARGTGESIRRSGTLGEEMYFYARKIEGRDTVLRGAIALTKLSTAMRLYDTSLVGSLLVLAVVSALFSIWSARSIFFPLGRLLSKTRVALDPSDGLARQETPRKARGGDEWSELESSIDSIRRDLAVKTQRLFLERVQLDTIMAAISDAILAVDGHGLPLFFNTRFETTFPSAARHDAPLKLKQLFDDPEIVNAFEQVLREGTVGHRKTIRLARESAATRYFALSVQPLRDSNQKVYGALGIFHDITEMKGAEQMRIDFVANAAHELRTPLTAIKGYGETLESDIVGGKPGDIGFVQAINRNTTRLMNLMNDLLDLSAMESMDRLMKEDISTEDVTKKILQQLQDRLEAKKQTGAYRIDSPLVHADPTRLEQVMVNLLENANKYGPEGARVSLCWRSDALGTILEVHNEGECIPREHHARLFERFYRVDKARSRGNGGTGLGLAIVKHIMQRHEGSVWVESERGAGVKFVCRFPSPGHHSGDTVRTGI